MVKNFKMDFKFLKSYLFNYRFYITLAAYAILALYMQSALVKMWMAFHAKAFAFTVDTNYLNWNTSFPAISICEVFNGEKLWDLNEEHYGSDRDKFQDDFIADIAFFNGQCISCKTCIQQQKSECYANFTNILDIFRSKCEKLIVDCSWNGENFTCCDAFLPLETEYGICYTINSVHTSPKYGKRLISDRMTGPGSLYVFVKEDIQIQLHSPYGVPIIGTDQDLQQTILWGLQKDIIFNTVEIFNDASLIEQKISQRKCRFPAENIEYGNMMLYDVYSYSTCVTACVASAQMAACNCTHHLMPGNRIKLLSDLRKNCLCLASCEEPEYNIVYSSSDYFGDDLGSPITISMISLPTTRFIRHTVRTTLDFIIAMGGILSLLFGASLMSLVEYGIIIFWKLLGFIKKITKIKLRKA
ncbi:4Fe-4S ferredoxin-type domain-containing protein [Sergentomyia squamirostris]